MSDATWWSDAVLDRSSWGELIEPALGRISTALNRERFPQSLLLVGPPCLGRELVAVEAAVMLACEGAEQPWSSSSCAERVRKGLHPDVRAVLPEGKAGKIKIDPIRDVAAEVAGRPYEARCRVWILDGVEIDRFGAEAANAFLKTLEEPPEHVRLLLLAANPMAVLPTIRSRCQQLTLPGPAVVAGLAAGDDIPPELAGAKLTGIELDGALSTIRAALESAGGGESRLLLKLPYAVSGDVSAFEVVATVATEMAAAAAEDDRGESLIRLASDLVATDRRCRAFNLDRDRQLVACLMRWFQER